MLGLSRALASLDRSIYLLPTSLVGIQLSTSRCLSSGRLLPSALVRLEADHEDDEDRECGGSCCRRMSRYADRRRSEGIELLPEGVCIFPSFPRSVQHKQSLSLFRRIKETIVMYSELGKLKLGSMVVVTTMAGYYMAPFSDFNWKRFLITSLGTGLAVVSANTFNHIIEAQLDQLMVRTSTRPLPSGRMGITHAMLFGVVTGVVGPSLLLAYVDRTAAALALSNIVLYAGIYTPLKQLHPINTWVGSIVGAIPPMIGWCAVTKGKVDLGAWTLGALLFLWQIPHFLSLSFPLKYDYARAGYKMLSVTNIDAVMSLSYLFSAALLPLGFVATYSGMTSWFYAIDSTLCNGYLLWKAHKFYLRRDNTSARQLFFASLIYLPLQMGLMLLHKNNFA